MIYYPLANIRLESGDLPWIKIYPIGLTWIVG
jgi:hypothetical protein